MPYLYYSYQLKRRIPLLDEAEWDGISALLESRIQSIIDYRKKTGCSLEEARLIDPVGKVALSAYQELAGLRLEHPDQLYALRLSKYGRPCPECERPFRTPKAHFCAECGYELPDGEIAGPANPKEIANLAVNIDKYSVFHDDVLVGHSRLEFGDPPMGIAHGKFIPASNFATLREKFPMIEDQDQRRWEGFNVRTRDGHAIQCEAGVVINEYGDLDDPFAIEVTCIGISEPKYEELFPHHVEAYKNSF